MAGPSIMSSQIAAAFEIAPGAMCIIDRQGRLIEANRSACTLLGVEPGRVIGASLAEVVPALAGGLPDRAVVALARAGASTIDVEVTTSVLAVDGDTLVEFSQVAEQQAKDELLERRRLQLVKAQAIGHFGSWQRDLLTGELDWSDETFHIVGMMPGTLSGVGDLMERIHPEDRSRVATALEEAIATRSPLDCTYRIVRPDGEERFVESRAEIVVDASGVARRIDGIIHDVTDRMRGEAERASLSMVLDVSDDAITACGEDGNFSLWNRGAEALYGHTAAEAIGQPLTLIVPTAVEELAWENFQRVLRGEAVAQQESTRVTKDGRSVIVAVTLSPMLDAGGRIIGVAAIGRDITRYKRTVAELAEAHEAAVEASRLKSQFMANMNHELRTPLNGVIGVGSLLERTALSDEQREYVSALRVSGSALMAVIDDILDFSKIEAGRLDLEDEPYDLRALVEDVCAVAAVGQAHRTVEVIAAIDSGVPTSVLGDAKRVRQVLANLANNAVKFTEIGQVAVRVDVEEAGSQIRCEVTDTGIGIDPRAQELIFDSFAQADGSTTRRYGGTGLGLAIARQLVTLMGGEIGVRSAVGAGSTFWFTLPLRAAADAERFEPAAVLAGARVLVVDDKATNREVLERRLREWGMTVATAADGETALALLRGAVREGEPYAVALVDYKMPGVSGDELPLAIRADAALRDTRLVMMVAARDTTAVAALTGLEGTLTKPLREAQLHDALAGALGGREHEPERPLDAATFARPKGRGRVLVAEDNPVNQLVAVRMLEQRGFEVDVAGDGRRAVEMHAERDYDAIFMDCQMPELDGYEATRLIRLREGTARHTPVIAFTASTLQGDIDRCLEAGMDHYCGKPIEGSALDEVLDRVLGGEAAPVAADAA
jgi:PAS domain S-box-containing protein